MADTRGDDRVPFGDGFGFDAAAAPEAAAAAEEEEEEEEDGDGRGIVPAGIEPGSVAGCAIRGLRRAPAAGLGGSNESTSIKGRLPRMLLGSHIALIAPRTCRNR